MYPILHSIHTIDYRLRTIQSTLRTIHYTLGPPLISDRDTTYGFQHFHDMECCQFQWEERGTIKEALKPVVPLVNYVFQPPQTISLFCILLYEVLNSQF